MISTPSSSTHLWSRAGSRIFAPASGHPAPPRLAVRHPRMVATASTAAPRGPRRWRRICGPTPRIVDQCQPATYLAQSPPASSVPSLPLPARTVGLRRHHATSSRYVPPELGNAHRPHGLRHHVATAPGLVNVDPRRRVLRHRPAVPVAAVSAGLLSHSPPPPARVAAAVAGGRSGCSKLVPRTA